MFDNRLTELTPEQRELFGLFLKRERLSLASAASYRPPGNETEAALIRIWSDLLHVEPGVDDNYFELGGDSITVIRMVSQARAAGIELRAEWVFSQPTIARLAAMSRLWQPAADTAAAPAAWRQPAAEIRDVDYELGRALARSGATPVDVFPLTPLQQGILYHTLERASDGCYAVHWRFRLKGPLDLPRFRAAWAQIIERHEALRTIFQWVGVDEPMQIIVDLAEGIVLEETNPGGAWASRAEEIAEEERRTDFDLRSAPLMRLRFLRIASDEWLCSWTHHHLILDGWSQQVLLEELFSAYCGLPLPPVARGSLRDHVHRMRAANHPSAAGYWRQRFAGFDAGKSHLGLAATPVHASLTQRIPHAGTLRAHLTRDASTLSAFYQSAWALALAQLAGSPDVAFGVITSGRSSGVAGIERAVGLFINTLPLRVAFDPSLPFRALLRTVQDEQAKLVEHESSSLLAIQQWLGWDRRTPLVESLYVYERFPVDFARLQRAAQLEISDVETMTYEHAPIVLVVQDEDETTSITLKHPRGTPERVRGFEAALGFIASLAERYVTAPDLPIRELLTIEPLRRSRYPSPNPD
jgi:nonribosomal peptide synthetase protein BlmV